MSAIEAAARRQRGDIAGARALLLSLLRTQQGDPATWHEWGLTLAAMGDETGAIAALRRAVALQPGRADSWRALGDLLVLMGGGPAAGEAYARAIQARLRDARLAPAANALCSGRADAAEGLLKAHVRQFPADLAALDLLAAAAMRVGRLVEAEAVLDHCLTQAAGFVEARHSLAILLYVQGKFAQAAPHFETLLTRAADDTSWRKLLAACLVRFGENARAIPHYEELLTAYRAQPKLWLLYAHALRTVGREQDAVAAYRTCIGLVPDAAEAYLSLADLKTITLCDSEIAALRARVAKPGTGTEETARLHYALGRAFEQRGAYADSFDHYANGARLRRGMIKYDANAAGAAMARARAFYTKAFFAARSNGGFRSDAPIYALGLARSGSTLVEQILASHPDVEATAELEEIGLIARELENDPSGYPAIIGQLDPAALARLGERYLARTAGYRRLGRRYFIDKMPDNFRHIGLIHLILPQARIIDVRRRPMAAGFAVFKQYFQSAQHGQDYSYDLTEIGRYYQDYAALMAHFDAVLPGRIVRVRYEDLVADSEGQIRALLDHCGLPFHPACLRFWETARVVQTPSAEQVRRPIFREGLEQWRHYEPWLAPLRAALGPLADT
jgi:predicted Zn-dependent protease